MTTPSDGDDERIREALKLWRQGDCVLGDYWFLYRVSDDENGAREDDVVGLMVLTQTCDIERDHEKRPYIEVCPLVKVEQDKSSPGLLEVKRGYRPNYAFVPSLEERQLVADLDRVMTVEKRILINWDRIEGCTTDESRRDLAKALARKRSRVAFPDDFVDLVSSLDGHIKAKYDEKVPDREELRDLREIRVRAAPSWEAEKIQLTFWFIRNDEQSEDNKVNWDDYLKIWLTHIPEISGRFVRNGSVLDLEELKASEYLESDQLDYDHLSSRQP